MKHIFASKTFWLNVIGMASLAIPQAAVNPTTLGYVLAGLNIATRVITKGPVYVLNDAATEP